MRRFDKYRTNLVLHDDKIYSYSTCVAIIDGKYLKQLGNWSRTTQKHINYAAEQLNLELKKLIKS
jgi:hypothetical protein|tara:strand:+ start:447 stop:641 length:195 start_codon:yes stop_codon:yes gene_type:complete